MCCGATSKWKSTTPTSDRTYITTDWKLTLTLYCQHPNKIKNHSPPPRCVKKKLISIKIGQPAMRCCIRTEHTGRIKRVKKCDGATSSFILRDWLILFIFEQEKRLFPQIDLQVELTRAKPEHYIMSWDADGAIPQVKIVSIHFWMKYQKLMPDAQMQVDEVLDRYYMLMPLSPRNDLLYLTIGTGVSFLQHKLFSMARRRPKWF